MSLSFIPTPPSSPPLSPSLPTPILIDSFSLPNQNLFRLRSLRASYSLPWGPNIPPRLPNPISPPPHSSSLPFLSPLSISPPNLPPPLSPQQPLLPAPTLLNPFSTHLSSPQDLFSSDSIHSIHFPSPPDHDPDSPLSHLPRSPHPHHPHSPVPDQSCSPGSSPLTGCSSCRSPLSHRSSCSSLHTLSSRSPLFDDLDGPLDDALVAGSLDLLSPSKARTSEELVIHANSWPVFQPPTSPPPSCGCTRSERVSSKDGLLHSASPPRALPRSFSGSLNLLVPTPLATHEPDPLLAPQEPNPAPPAPVETRTRLPRRKQRPTESLLTKSLRRLSRKLPNIQWGILSSRAWSEVEEEEEDVLSSLINGGAGSVVGTDGLEELQDEQEEQDESLEKEQEARRRIARLVKSWTSDTIQPQNRHSGRFIDDPEMEWSSMMVQLETFSPRRSSSVSPRQRTSRSRPSRRRPCETMMTASTITSSPSHPTSPSTRQRQRRDRQRTGEAVILRRVVANPMHLLMLTLELEMMRKKKIVGPLRQRAVRLIVVRRPTTSPGGDDDGEKGIIGEKEVRGCEGARGSPLKFEVIW